MSIWLIIDLLEKVINLISKFFIVMGGEILVIEEIILTIFEIIYVYSMLGKKKKLYLKLHIVSIILSLLFAFIDLLIEKSFDSFVLLDFVTFGYSIFMYFYSHHSKKVDEYFKVNR